MNVYVFVLSLLFKANSHLIIHIWRQLHDDKSKSSATWIYALCARTVQQHKRRDTLTIIRIVESRARVNVKKATITRKTNNNTKRTHKQKTQVLWTRKKAPPIIFFEESESTEHSHVIHSQRLFDNWIFHFRSLHDTDSHTLNDDNGGTTIINHHREKNANAFQHTHNMDRIGAEAGEMNRYLMCKLKNMLHDLIARNDKDRTRWASNERVKEKGNS